MTMPTTTGCFNCRSPFRRFIVERCTGAVAALTQLSSAQRSAVNRSLRGTARGLWTPTRTATGTGTGTGRGCYQCRFNRTYKQPRGMPCINVPKLDKHGANAIDRRHTHTHTRCLAAAEPNPMPRSPFQGVSWCACFILSFLSFCCRRFVSFRFGLFFSFLFFRFLS